MNDPGHPARNEPIRRDFPRRRQRAPTITIDTSAVSPSHQPVTQSPERARDGGGGPPYVREDGESYDNGPSPMDFSPTDLRLARSFESRDGRPTSPHNVSSPVKNAGHMQNFLSVPSTRSRGGSVDSEDLAQSPTSYGGDTYIPSTSSSQNGESGRRLGTAQSVDPLIADGDALKPDPGTESDFEVDDNRFAFSPGQLGKLFNPKSLGAFHALGGLRGLEKGLRTNRYSGLPLDEKSLNAAVTFDEAIAAARTEQNRDTSRPGFNRTATSSSAPRTEESFVDRRRVFSDNRLPEKKAKSILELAWMAYNDKVLILLTVAAVVSLALGIYQSVTAKDGQARVEWVEGVAIIVAILIVVVVGASNDWQKERQFVKLNKKKDDRVIKVIRSGRSREISVHDILVGDVVHLEPGDMVPVDGIFIDGHSIKCDESSATGESDLLKKTPADEVYKALEAPNRNLRKLDPFIISGSKVNEGVGTFLVTATGINSSHGKTMLSLREDAQTTPLQSKLNVLAEYIAKLGLGAGLILFIVTFIQFCVRLSSIPGGPGAKGQAFLRLFITAVTIIVVAVPEGLPLAVTLALAFATTRMLKDNNLVRLLRACETMGNATTICSDKTGTLTQNRMTVVAGTIGTASRFRDTKGIKSREPEDGNVPKEVGMRQNVPELTAAEAVENLHADARDVLRQSIIMNTTAFEGEVDSQAGFIGSKTEIALLGFARDHLGMGSLDEERSNMEAVQVEPFDSSRKCMATVIRLSTGRYRLLVKGASEIMLDKCQNILRDPTKDLTVTHLSRETVDMLRQVIDEYASRSLRTIGLLFKDFDHWPPRGCPTKKDEPKQALFEKVFADMTFLGIVGIQDPLREGVADAVRACQKAGVIVRMVTGDNMLTAKAIAESCGIYTPGGIVMEGPQFRKMSRFQMSQTVPRLQVLARSSPEDKRILVKRLKEMGETVAVTGDGTNDAPALKTADVGFSMGIAGTEVAKEASDIILMDDNFASIVKAIMWGRSVNDAVKKFLQFQVTVNITAVLLTFISAVANSQETSVLTAVQLLWVNLIMDTFAALALATDPPTPAILDRKPEPRSAPLISLTMWKMIIGQSIYQLVVTLVLYFIGCDILGYQCDTNSDKSQYRVLQTLVFNTFVWMQIFNQYNSRRVDNKLNIFEGILRNYFFVGIQVIIVAGQVIIIFLGGDAFAVTRQNGTQWGIALVLGLISLPVAVAIRLVPDEWISKCIPDTLKRRVTPELLVSDEERQFQWNPALEDIKEELKFMKMIRGGRMNRLRYKLQHPSELLPRSGSASRSRASSIAPQTPTNEQASEIGPAPQTPESRRSQARRSGRSRSNSAFGPAAAMAGIVAGSIAGWNPIDRREDDDDSRIALQDRSDIENTAGVELHPHTGANDPVIVDPAKTGDANLPPSQRLETTPSSDQPSTSLRSPSSATHQ